MRLVALTSQDVEAALRRNAIMVVPVGSIEQHGPHLPVGTDSLIVEYIATQATEVTGDVVAPTVSFGYNEKELMFPGTVSVKLITLTHYLLDICESLVKTGFCRVVLLNGHGWNKPALSAAAHMLAESTEVLCAATSYYDLISDVAEEIRESEFPGGMSHAGEFETSIALFLNFEGMRIEKAVKEISFPRSKFSWLDIVTPPKISIPRKFSKYSRSGVIGDPTLATSQKGERLVKEAVVRVADFLRSFKEGDVLAESA
jgi:creatinine amidohydrolase